jgi:hypothetical protein
VLNPVIIRPAERQGADGAATVQRWWRRRIRRDCKKWRSGGGSWRQSGSTLPGRGLLVVVVLVLELVVKLVVELV